MKESILVRQAAGEMVCSWSSSFAQFALQDVAIVFIFPFFVFLILCFLFPV